MVKVGQKAEGEMQIAYPRTSRTTAEVSEADTASAEGRRKTILRELARRDDSQGSAEEDVIEATAAPVAAEAQTAIPDVSSVIQRVSGISVAELDKAISDLRQLRDFLHSEGERMHKEMSNYLRLSQAARGSTKVISEAMMSLGAVALNVGKGHDDGEDASSVAPEASIS
jgi:hypothetical protein